MTGFRVPDLANWMTSQEIRPAPNCVGAGRTIVPPAGVEPATSALSGLRSNHLSYNGETVGRLLASDQDWNTSVCVSSLVP